MYKFSALLFVFLIGCKSTKQSSTSDKKDSIRIEVQKIILPAISDTIFIENPCDTNGILLPFKERFSYGQGKVSIQSNKGKIRVVVRLKEYITKDSIVYRYKYITKTEYKEVEKKSLPWWIFIIGGLALIGLNSIRK